MTKKNQTPALLDNPAIKKEYVVELETNSSAKVFMKFSDKLMAQQEFNKIKSQGTYGGQWIKFVDFYDIKVD